MHNTEEKMKKERSKKILKERRRNIRLEDGKNETNSIKKV